MSRGKSSATVHSGFSLLEVLVSSFILSILAVSLVHGLTTLEIESRLAKDRMSAALLAADLREEILSKFSVDPGGTPQFGLESGDGPRPARGRLSFDDQDDYEGLVDRPVTDIRGNPLPGVDRIWRTCRIERVSPDNPDGPSIDTRPIGLRRFTVTVFRDEAELAHLTWLGVGHPPSP